jgi:hypothetical protein
VFAAARLKSLMKIKFDRIISIATLLASLAAIILVLKKPAPVAQPQTPAAIAAHAQSFDQKMERFEEASQAERQPVLSSSATYQSQVSPSQTPPPVPSASAPQQKAEVHLNSDEVGAALAQSLGNAGAGAMGGGELTADSNLGSGQPTIKDQQVSFEGDMVHGQFLTEIGGKDVWVTVSGHLGSSNGYATFDPTEFKVGDLSVPVSLVNPALQKKLADQQDRMKLPNNVGSLKVDNGELVMQQK